MKVFVIEMSDWRSIHEQKNQKKRFENEIQFGDLEDEDEEEDEDVTFINESTSQPNQDKRLKNGDITCSNKHNTK